MGNLKWRRVLLAGVSLAILLPYGSVKAREASFRTLTATVAINPALELICTPVKFGVWRLRPRSSGGTTLVMLDVDKPELGPQLFGNTNGIASVAGRPDWSWSHGVCTFSGSAAIDDSSVSVTITNNRFIRVTGDASAYEGVPAPETPAGGIKVDIYTVTGARVFDGAANFIVGGSLTIPQTITSANFGGYRVTTNPTISVNDHMP